MSDLVGQQLGTYHLLRVLGEGSFASVYLGEPVSSGASVNSSSQVVIKVFHTPISGQEAVLLRQDEALLTRLKHPNLVRVFAFGLQSSTAFLVMAYISGGTLRQRHPAGSQLELPLIATYLQQLAWALDYLYQHELVHGNLKPENLLLEQDQRVLLSDFSTPLVTRYLRPEASSEAMRTSIYQAPERIQGRIHPASDQYALAVLVYEWLTGRPPFAGSMAELSSQHLFATPASLCEQVPGLPAAVEQVVLTALAKEPRQRFASVLDFATVFLSAAQLPAAAQPLVEVDEPASPTRSERVATEAGTTPVASAATSQGAEQPPAAKPAPMWKVPSTFTPLVGREQEVTEITALLKQPEMRLLILLGPGGIGKTRLSIAVASSMRDYFVDGICFVGLSAIRDPELVISTIAQELGLKESGTRLLLEQVQTFVGEQHFLLVLDNFEQVVAAAQEVEELLAACPHLTILVTSRAVLHLSAEQLVAVAPLALPDLAKGLTPDGIAQAAAVTLFVQRARSQLPSFRLTAANAQAIAEVCVRLDGLPLAIELAAARVRLLPPQALLSHLAQRLQVLTGGPRSLPARQQTLRNTLQWSYDLLGPEEQALFRLIAVFVDGWTLEAAEAVCQAVGKTEVDTVDGLSTLLDNSLVQSSTQEEEESRFLMLQSVQEYGLECLQASGEAQAVHHTHADYYLHLAEEVVPRLKGADQLVWLARLAREQENLRAALGWLIEQEEGEPALHLSAALWWFWFMHGDWSEGRRWLEAALQLPSAQAPTAARATVLSGAGELAWSLGDHSAAQRLLSESVSLSQELGDERGLAGSLGVLGLVMQEQGEMAEGHSRVEEGLTLCRRLGRTWDLARLLLNAGLTAQRQGNGPQALALFQEGLPLARKLGDRYLITYGLTYWGGTLFGQGDKTQAKALMEEGLTIARELGDKRFLADGLNNLGYLTFLQGDLLQAAALAEEALTIARELGHTPSLVVTLDTLAQIVHAQGNTKQAEALYLEGFSLALKSKYVVWAVDCLVGLASVVESQGQIERAARLLGAAETLVDVKEHLAPDERADYEQAVAAARRELGEEAFAAAWKEGQTAPLEQVVGEALKRG